MTLSPPGAHPMTGRPTRVVAVTTGTSVDALDVVAADVRADGDHLDLVPLGHGEAALDPALRTAVLDVLPPATTTAADLCRLDVALGHAAASAASAAIADLAGGRADVVTLLGQTVHHDVTDDGTVTGTLQLGQATAVAEATGVPVVADLRTRDVAAGGQGAPLVSFLDVLLLRGLATDGRVALCNLGGIANLTVVRDDGDPIAFDVGPANALLDAEVRRATGADRDDGGALAAAGTVDLSLLEVLLDDAYLAAPPPKSTGKERYNLDHLDAALGRAPVDDVRDRLATLAEAVAVSIADQLRRLDVSRVWCSGGGVRNAHLLARLDHHVAATGASLATTDDLGLPTDAKEAYAIALLGWATWHGIPATVPSCTGARGARILGSLTPGDGPLRLPPPLEVTPRTLRVVRPRGAADLVAGPAAAGHLAEVRP